jgi:hypothetical protein
LPSGPRCAMLSARLPPSLRLVNRASYMMQQATDHAHLQAGFYQMLKLAMQYDCQYWLLDVRRCPPRPAAPNSSSGLRKRFTGAPGAGTHSRSVPSVPVAPNALQRRSAITGAAGNQSTPATKQPRLSRKDGVRRGCGSRLPTIGLLAGVASSPALLLVRAGEVYAASVAGPASAAGPSW